MDKPKRPDTLGCFECLMLNKQRLVQHHVFCQFSHGFIAMMRTISWSSLGQVLRFSRRERHENKMGIPYHIELDWKYMRSLICKRRNRKCGKSFPTLRAYWFSPMLRAVYVFWFFLVQLHVSDHVEPQTNLLGWFGVSYLEGRRYDSIIAHKWWWFEKVNKSWKERNGNISRLTADTFLYNGCLVLATATRSRTRILDLH